jgi:hypothetical protein
LTQVVPNRAAPRLWFYFPTDGDDETVRSGTLKIT